MAARLPNLLADPEAPAGPDGQQVPSKAKSFSNNSSMSEVSDGNAAPEPAEDGAAAERTWKTFVNENREVVVLPLSLLILVFFLCVQLDETRPQASKGAAVLVITAMWWFTEVVPLTITSLLPLVLYPLLGVVKVKVLATKFFRSTSFLFVAGFFIGLAVERWGLHTRVVCGVVGHAGKRIELLVGGFMLSVWMLSMWISNSATIMCMLPMAQGFLSTLPPGHERFQSAFLLAIGYSATIGGIATPVGTPTNGIFMEQFVAFWPGEGEFSFAKFFLCAFPLSFLLLIVVWLGFCIVFVWRSSAEIPVDQEVFASIRRELGKVSFEQIVVGIDGLLLIAFWFTASKIDAFPGWKTYVAPDLDSSSIGLFLTLPLFLLPCGAQLPKPLQRIIGEDRCLSSGPRGQQPRRILDWQQVKNNFQWEILFVFGGGAVIAHGTVVSGLAAWAAELLSRAAIGELAFVMLVSFVICFVTEVVSNMATLSIFGAIIAATAQLKGFDPVQMLLVVCFSASFAFMLPMAGGPNMIVYSTGKISVPTMARFGLALNIVAILLGSLYMGLVMPLALGSYADLPAPVSD